MENYPLVVEVFLGLDKSYQDVIVDVCDRMGNGMADFVPRDVRQSEARRGGGGGRRGAPAVAAAPNPSRPPPPTPPRTRVAQVESVKQYNLYCHYVAGLVGIGLSQVWVRWRCAPCALAPLTPARPPGLLLLTLQLFASSGCESADIATATDLANQMGLFLQKTNIVRDYLVRPQLASACALPPSARACPRAPPPSPHPPCALPLCTQEDINELPAPRMWWPHEIWGKYATRLADFKQPAHAAAAVACLNHMVLNALGHVPSCLKYMQQLRHPGVFRFCAIPQARPRGGGA